MVDDATSIVDKISGNLSSISLFLHEIQEKTIVLSKNQSFSWTFEISYEDNKPVLNRYGNFPALTSDAVEKGELVSRNAKWILTDKEESYVISIELPGILAENIKFHVLEAKELEIRAKNPDQTFRYVADIRLPSKVKSQQTEAKLSNGILYVELVKLDEKEDKFKVSIIG